MYTPTEFSTPRILTLSVVLTAGLHYETVLCSDVRTVVPHSSGFHVSRFQVHKPHVHRIPDIPMEQMPRDGFIIGIFSIALMVATRPLSDGRSRFLRVFATCDVPSFLSSGTPIRRFPDAPKCQRALDLHHVSISNERLQISSDLSPLVSEV